MDVFGTMVPFQCLIFVTAILLTTAFKNILQQKAESRIINGYEASEKQFPFQALLLIKTKDPEVTICGGSIISQTYILTAAHCNVG